MKTLEEIWKATWDTPFAILTDAEIKHGYKKFSKLAELLDEAGPAFFITAQEVKRCIHELEDMWALTHRESVDVVTVID